MVGILLPQLVNEVAHGEDCDFAIQITYFFSALLLVLRYLVQGAVDLLMQFGN